MPELPEVETIVRQLRSKIIGKKIADVWSERERTLGDTSLANFRALTKDTTIASVSRRAKYIVIHLDSEQCIAIHLKMSGWLKLLQSNPSTQEPYIRASLSFGDGSALVFADPRRFGRMHLIHNFDTWSNSMGVEPFDIERFTPEAIATLVKNRTLPIKAFLLDQSHISGIGNIYADEILWASKIHPERPGCSLTEHEINEIHQNAPQILRTAIASNGSTLRNYRDLRGLEGGYMDIANCYGREGQPCKRNDDGIIQRIVIRTRSAHFCPVCQK